MQAEVHDYPADFFAPRTWRIRRPESDPRETADVAAMIAAASRPVIVAGGGVVYSGAEDRLAAFAEKHNIPLVETQAGKGGLAADHRLNFGSPGAAGSDCANELCMAADLVIGVGTRFQDFTTGSWSVFGNAGRRLVSINLHPFDAQKHLAQPLVADARVALARLSEALGDLGFDAHDPASKAAWLAQANRVTDAPAADSNALPTDAHVIGAVQRAAKENTVVMCAAGTMPGALQVLWQSAKGGYHMEYGGAELNNMYKDSNVETQPEIDFVAHARSMGAHAVKAADLPSLEAEIAAARGRDIPTVIVIDTDAVPGTDAGGHWWDVAVPQTGGPERLEARERYNANAALQRTYN